MYLVDPGCCSQAYHLVNPPFESISRLNYEMVFPFFQQESPGSVNQNWSFHHGCFELESVVMFAIWKLEYPLQKKQVSQIRLRIPHFESPTWLPLGYIFSCHGISMEFRQSNSSIVQSFVARFSPQKKGHFPSRPQRPPPGKLNHPHCHPASLVETGPENIISCRFFCFSMPSKTYFADLFFKS